VRAQLLRLGDVEAQAAAAHVTRGVSPGELLSLLVPGADVALTSDQAGQLKRVLQRADELSGVAAGCGVTLLIDAEQTYLQPAIDHVAIAMMRKHNRPRSALWQPPESTHVLLHAAAMARAHSMTPTSGDVQAPAAGSAAAAWPYNPPECMATGNQRFARTPSGGTDEGRAFPVVYNTYQAYLRDSLSRLQLAVRRSRREGWLMGAKLVRGAYMVQERALAAEKGYNDPIHRAWLKQWVGGGRGTLRASRRTLTSAPPPRLLPQAPLKTRMRATTRVRTCCFRRRLRRAAR
jgi:hypothetical protein